MCLGVSVNSTGIRGIMQSWRRKGRLRWEGFTEKEVFKPGLKEWESDDESGESMEPMEEAPLKELSDSESELERSVRGWRREAESWFQRRFCVWGVSVCLRVCLCTGHTRGPRALQNGWIDQNAPWKRKLVWAKEPCIRRVYTLTPPGESVRGGDAALCQIT